MDKELLKELAYQDEKLKEKIIGPTTKDFIENLSSRYDMDAIKENIEQVNKRNSVWTGITKVSFGYFIIVIITAIYWYLWGFFTGIFVGFCTFIFIALLEEPCDIMAGYNEQCISMIKGYNRAKSKDDELNKKK